MKSLRRGSLCLVVKPGCTVRAIIVFKKHHQYTILGSPEKSAAQHRTLQGIVNQTTMAVSQNHERVSIEKPSQTHLCLDAVLIQPGLYVNSKSKNAGDKLWQWRTYLDSLDRWQHAVEGTSKDGLCRTPSAGD